MAPPSAWAPPRCSTPSSASASSTTASDDLAPTKRPSTACLGVYVHIPFCTRRCDYCAFATWTDRDHLQDAYVDALLEEAAGASARGELGPAATIYLGGGTPSVLGGKRLARILAAIEREPGAEVSVECNPETTTEPLLEALAAAGVTRISLGVQSMQSHVLAGLGRQHDPAEAKRAAKLVGEAGFSYNVDLIYGGAFESDDDWVATLETVCGFDPPPAHVSAYALSVEPGTPLAFDPARHPDDDVQAQRYAIADAILSDAGLEWYELSSWARPGSECRHNLGYWRQGPYCGLGCAAHSHRDGRRSWNIRPLERYLQAIATRGEATAGEERLGPAEVALERLELSLRTREGVHVSAFDPSGLAGLREEGPLGPLVRVTRGRVVLTLRGRLLYNEVACRLMTPYVLTPIGQG